MQALREQLSRIFPEECFLPGTRIEENRRVFSIKPDAGEAVIGLKLSPLANRWPENHGICDGLFVCKAQNCNHLIVTLVELKGGDVSKAMNQIRDTCHLLCKSANPVLQIHSEDVIDAAESLNIKGHGKGALGVIVARSGLAQNQKAKKLLWDRYRLRIWSKTGKLEAINCSLLAGKFAGTN
ncbi:MAG: hypothetical protein HY912_11010 [Desulfomonile tiedjei]|uniref:Uncharacterized protein n=1 Tax=Desulfomonile tiedjei TaxID=2358 RepID=A0A9D6V176_9BACT|nr:hypothetical protein [Desulfomonile tiedjei]